jgi:hypothetical protein
MYSFLHVSGRYCAATNPGEWLQMAGLHQKGSGYHNSGVVELKLEDFKPFANTVLWLEWNSKYRTKSSIWLVKLGSCATHD